MKIVIDIHEAIYEDAINYIPTGLSQYIDEAIRNGKPLPKGHGDLIDRDILLQNWKVIPSRDRLIFDRYIQTLNGVIPANK